MDISEESFSVLIAQYQAVKNKEVQIAEYRRRLEEQICAAMPGDMSSTQSRVVDGVKVKVERRLQYSVEPEAFEKETKANIFLDEISRLWPVRIKLEVDVKKYKAVIENGLMMKCAKFISVKPAKPSVSVEVINEN